MSGFTKGPWFAIPHGKNSRAWKVTTDPDDARQDIANIIDFGEIKAEANARLIAAAPELLDAADNLISDVHNRFPSEELRCPYMQALDSAIAKAKGEGA